MNLEENQLLVRVVSNSKAVHTVAEGMRARYRRSERQCEPDGAGAGGGSKAKSKRRIFNANMAAPPKKAPKCAVR